MVAGPGPAPLGVVGAIVEVGVEAVVVVPAGKVEEAGAAEVVLATSLHAS